MRSRTLKNDVNFSRDRTRRALKLLQEAVDRQEGIVGETADLVENQVPENVRRGSREHALFLFAVVPSDRGVKSSLLWSRARQMHGEFPWLFEPSSFQDLSLNEAVGRVRELLSMYLKPRYATNAAVGWVNNAKRLTADFEADARKVFAQGQNGADAYKAIRSFFGFGPKTGGMMYRAATGLGWASAEAASGVDMPVDTHDVRIAIQLRILTSRDPIATSDFQRYASLVRRELTEACQELGGEWFGIDRAMWLIGSRGCARRRCGLCPLVDECSKAEGAAPDGQLRLAGLP